MVQSFRTKRPATTRTVTGAPVEEVPEWWTGSQPEYWVYRAIIRTGRLEEAGGESEVGVFRTNFVEPRQSRDR